MYRRFRWQSEPSCRRLPPTISDSDGINYRKADILIYFGVDTNVSESGWLEGGYTDLFTLEAAIRAKLDTDGGQETIKMMAIRAKVEG